MSLNCFYLKSRVFSTWADSRAGLILELGCIASDRSTSKDSAIGI